MLINDALNLAASQLKAVTVVPALEAKWFMEWVLGESGTYLLLNGQKELSDEAQQAFFDCVNRRLLREPFQYITGEQEFMGLTFEVNPDVLIPRRDTECLVELIIDAFKEKGPVIAADLGSGSGAIGVSLAYYLPHMHMTCVDFSSGALAMTEKNAQRLLLGEAFSRFNTWLGDMFEFLSASGAGHYDLIVSNPPYIPSQDIESLEPEVKTHEPMTALDGGKDGYDYYRRLVKMGKEALKPGGWMLFEVGHDQAEVVQQLFLDDGAYEDIQCYRDLQGIQRMVGAHKIK